jgi:hypothetical protein
MSTSRAKNFLCAHVHFLILIGEQVMVVLREAQLARLVIHIFILPAIVGQRTALVQSSELLAS